MAKISDKIRVIGRVQGVFFRGSTRQQAQQHQLTGYARNLADGSVEILLQGEAESVEKVSQWIAAGGPPAARVDHMLRESCDYCELSEFTIA